MKFCISIVLCWSGDSLEIRYLLLITKLLMSRLQFACFYNFFLEVIVDVSHEMSY